jgi:hypothetical protein
VLCRNDIIHTGHLTGRGRNFSDRCRRESFTDRKEPQINKEKVLWAKETINYASLLLTAIFFFSLSLNLDPHRHSCNIRLLSDKWGSFMTMRLYYVVLKQ